MEFILWKIESVTKGGRKLSSFTYHIDGQLAEAVTPEKRESFQWDGLALIQRNSTSYVNEPAVTGGNPILADDKVLFNDMLGTTLGIKDGDKVTQNNLTAFGESLGASPMQDSFFTGKPCIGELGYAFLFRNYRADQGKWQTSDPLGYPDGWNNFAYCNNNISNVDPLGLEGVLGYYYYYNGYYYYTQDANCFTGGTVKTEINNLTDALAHYRSGAGGVVSAGAGLYSEMGSHSTYKEGIVGNDSRVAQAIKQQLSGVARNVSSGSFTRSSFVGALECSTLGSYRLDYSCTVNWYATDWTYDSVEKCYYRYVTAPVTVSFSGSDRWDFEWNASYNLWQNITRELIPGWIAGARGNPNPFTITFSTSASYGLSVKQYE